MRYFVLVLKLVVVPVGLWLLAAGLLRDPRVGTLRPDLPLLMGALLANQLALLMFAVRMRGVLAAFGITIAVRQALKVHLQSMFYFFALPMTVGQEMARFAKIKGLAGPSSSSVSLTLALLADRLIGALAAFIIAVALLPFVRIAALGNAGQLGAWIGALAVLALVAAALLMKRRAPGRMRELAHAARASAVPLAAAFIVALLTHCLFGFAVYLGAVGSGVAIGPLETLFAISAAMLFVVVPVSFAGISPVEAANVGVAVALGVPFDQAAVFALVGYVAKLVAAFEGGAWEISEGGIQALRLLTATRKTRDESLIP